MPPYTATRPIPPEIRDQLNKLMLVLGSVNEGESAAAAGRITGLLKRHGLDWHDIVGSIGQAARSAPKPPPRKAKSYTGPQTMTFSELMQLVQLICAVRSTRKRASFWPACSIARRSLARSRFPTSNGYGSRIWRGGRVRYECRWLFNFSSSESGGNV